MSGTLESLQRRRKSAGDLALVVRTMKAMAVSNITQYEMAVDSLQGYFRTILMGLHNSFRNEKFIFSSNSDHIDKVTNVAIVFGSDQGLVGSFNHSISVFTKDKLQSIIGKNETWAVGERIFLRLQDEGLSPVKLFAVPNSVSGITPLVNSILIHIEEYRSKNKNCNYFTFYNSPLSGESYEPHFQHLFPVDRQWRDEIARLHWPSNNLPQIIGDKEETFRTLISEYLFVSLFRACAESLNSENASRLAAMQRAKKNIEEIMVELLQNYNRLRQSTIDEELFDVIAGFEALKKKN